MQLSLLFNRQALLFNRQAATFIQQAATKSFIWKSKKTKKYKKKPPNPYIQYTYSASQS